MPVSTAEPAPIAVAELDAARAADAAAELVPCCASRRWVAAMVNGRPYATLNGLGGASDAVVARLEWSDIEEALAAQPRLAECAGGDGRRATWTRGEQPRSAPVPERTRQALREGDRAYEGRFGHVFLVCPAGLSAEQMLAALRARLANDPVAERQIVRTELAKIVRRRLGRSFR